MAYKNLRQDLLAQRNKINSLLTEPTWNYNTARVISKLKLSRNLFIWASVL
jgi:hypothetical protein